MKIDKVEKYDLDINGYKISLSRTELLELHTMIGNTLGLNSININAPYDNTKKQYEEWKYPYPTDSVHTFSYGAGSVDTITLTNNNDYKITLGD